MLLTENEVHAIWSNIATTRSQLKTKFVFILYIQLWCIYVDIASTTLVLNIKFGYLLKNKIMHLSLK